MTYQINRVRLTALSASLFSLLGGTTQLDATATTLQSATPAAQIAQQVPAQPVPAQPMAEPEMSVAVPAVDFPLDEARPASAASLAALVSAQSQSGELPRELNCLAGAVYFEAKSEALTGQLAVGRVIVARSKSGRFPNSYCGVVFQRSQFSFVRGGGMPGINRQSRQWRNAVAIAQIAHAGTWRSPVEGALYFHAARVSPSWKRTRMARVQNHVFYR